MVGRVMFLKQVVPRVISKARILSDRTLADRTKRLGTSPFSGQTRVFTQPWSRSGAKTLAPVETSAPATGSQEDDPVAEPCRSTIVVRGSSRARAQCPGRLRCTR